MKEEYRQINNFLVKVFNEILRNEEAILQIGTCKNLSIREMHVIEAICLAQESGSNTASEIALAQNITAGTLTTSVNRLEEKGFVSRQMDKQDRRVVRIFPTASGIAANQVHQAFHHNLVEAIMGALSPEELAVFVKGLNAVRNFFETEPKTGGSM